MFDTFVSSPRTWGCFPQCAIVDEYHEVFPTHVGVFLTVIVRTPEDPGLPHARGGVSFISTAFIPRFQVFPTHVGVFLDLGYVKSLLRCLPHARGGVSAKLPLTGGTMLSSPRTWGCFSPEDAKENAEGVFPTHVGVFLPP